MTSGNIFPAGLLILFLATGTDFMDVQSVRSNIARADLHLVLVSLSDACESSLHLRSSAEDARSSLLRLASDFEDHVASVAATLLDETADVVVRDTAWCRTFRRTVMRMPVHNHIDSVPVERTGQSR